MKKLILTAIIAIGAWCIAQAQSQPAPEKYNEFIEQIGQLDKVKGEFLVNATMEALSNDPKGYRQMMELAERRFSDPADPLHNESFYMAVLKHTTEHYVLSAGEIERQRLLLEGAKKNMEGSVAADFDYITPKDKTVHHLKDLKADYILVYFNNPDCSSCEKVMERLEKSEMINKLVNDKKLIVLGIYPYDDQKLWKKAKYPKMMINGWNQSRQIEYGELYDLPTLPCFYLLDKTYTVLVKNEGSLNKIEAKLDDLLNPKEPEPAPAAAPVKKADKPAPPKPTYTPAPESDPNTARSEEILDMMEKNDAQGLYNSLSDIVKGQAKPETFEGALSQVEERMGKYLGHEGWLIQQKQNMKAYTTLLNFEKSQLGLHIVYDKQGKVVGLSVLPATAVTPQD